MSRGGRTGIAKLAALAIAAIAFLTIAAPAFGQSIRGDFNGDGFDDLAVGIQGDTVVTNGTSMQDAGAVAVIYGSATGPSATASPGAQLWTQDTPGILEKAAPNDEFGHSLAAGDFNGDGYDDLAVGVWREAIGSTTSVQNAGGVNVIYGSASGLTAAGNQFWSQGSPGIAGAPSDYDLFGSAMTAGDFDGNGVDDLAVGAFWDQVGSADSAGSVTVIYGTASSGLTSTGSQLWTEDSPGVAGTAAVGNYFGDSVAAGDFNHDMRDDLAVGVPGEIAGSKTQAGAVDVLPGSSSGVTASGSQMLTQDSPGVAGTAGASDQLGKAVAAGDFDGDGFDDLAAGAWQDDVPGVQAAGAVNVFYGSAGGVTGQRSQIWTQNSPGVLDSASAGDRLGSTLVAGDFNGDTRDDLAAGAYVEDIGSVVDAGGVNVLYGSLTGLTATGNQFWSQQSPGIADSASRGDMFGADLSAGRFSGGAADDLVVGVLNEDLGGRTDAGAAHVIPGAPGGLTATGSQLWTQDSPGVPGRAETRDNFGEGL